MKQLYICSFLIILSLLSFSCEKDETKAILDPQGSAPAIVSQQSGFSQVITQEILAQKLYFAWSESDYGVKTQVTYTLELDSAGRSFASPVAIGTTSNDTLVVTLDDLNKKILDNLKLVPNVNSSLELRVVATVNNKFKSVSGVINISVKTWKKIEVEAPATLWLPGSYQNWSPSTAPTIKAISATEFEGYVYIKEGAGFKFTSAPDWNHINYGDSGTPGVLTTDGLANGLSLNVAGYYKFYVDVKNLKYDIVLVTSWGMIGTATPGNWDSDVNMDFNQTTGVWSKKIDLVPGALKFRANDDWGLNYGPVDSNVLTGILTKTDGAIDIKEAGNYTVTIDLSRSEAPYKYKYSVIKN